MQMQNGYFRNPDGTRYIPMGMFACYFKASYIGEQLGARSQHGDDLLEFQRCTRGIWEEFFTFLREEGCTAIRMFPRGDSGGSAWEGLDIGGRVNRPLLTQILAYAECARAYGIRLQLGLFTEPECSFYCRADTRRYWGRRLWSPEEIAAASPSQRRFLDDPDDIVPYNDFFSDPDVRVCCHAFLDELMPLLAGNADIFGVEVFNEMGWASPHETPPNTFRWEITDAYLDWSRGMVDHIRRLAPDLPACISNPGVGLLGHDNIQWANAIRPDYFSIHNYPDICGALPGTDYAAVCDMIYRYTSLAAPSMYGEWQAQFKKPDAAAERLLALNARDIAWLTLLSGALGCISWCARGYGMYKCVSDVFARLEGRCVTPAAPALKIDVRAAHDWFVSLVDGGADECALPPHKWCPDRSATDGKHRFCVKAESAYHRHMVEVERWALETGADYAFSLEGGVPLLEVTREMLEAAAPAIAPVEGYHQKTLHAADGRTKVVFLRNYEAVPFHANSVDGLPVERFCLRSQTPRPVVLGFADEGFACELLDLDTGEWTRPFPAQGSLGLGVTSHDFIALLTK